MTEIGPVTVTSRSRTVLAVAATALCVAVTACAPARARSPQRVIPTPPACNPALTVGHVPGHLDRVWQLVCADETTNSGHTNRPASPPATPP
jgi:hypothetical protein